MEFISRSANERFGGVPLSIEWNFQVSIEMIEYLVLSRAVIVPFDECLNGRQVLKD